MLWKNEDIIIRCDTKSFGVTFQIVENHTFINDETKMFFMDYIVNSIRKRHKYFCNFRESFVRMNLKYVVRLWTWASHRVLIVKKIYRLIHFHKTIVDHRLVMIKDFDKVSNLRKMYSIFILWTIIFMSHHMTILGTSTTNCWIMSDSSNISEKQNVFP